MKNINTKKGFTIIEVVLVLAIAGLIFLMVFIALPNLQRSQRDTQRRNDYSQLAANIQGYITNNGGDLPKATNTNLAADKYINADGTDPNGLLYNAESADDTSSTYAGKINVKACDANDANGKCNGLEELTSVSNQATPTKVFVVLNANCSGDGANGTVPSHVSSTRSFAVYGQLESGTYCQAQ